MKQPRFTCCAARRAPLLSPGFDSYQGDLQSAFRVEAGAYSAIGGHIASLNLPVLFVQVDGYATDALPILAQNFFGGFIAGWG